jgi:hypothetical protein
MMGSFIAVTLVPNAWFGKGRMTTGTVNATPKPLITSKADTTKYRSNPIVSLPRAFTFRISVLFFDPKPPFFSSSRNLDPCLNFFIV